MWKRIWRTVQHGRLWIFLLLVGGLALFHWQGLQPGYTFLPVDLANNNLPWRDGEPQPLQNWLISDPLYQFYPFTHTAVDSLKQRREWLLWNPHILLGHPAGADPLFQTYYPLNVIAGLFFGPTRGLAVGLWLQVVLAALLTYGWLRSRDMNQPAALAGAFIYALGGYLVTWFETTFWVSTLAWFPGVMWAFERSIQEKRLRYVGLTAGALTLAVLGGQLQFLVVFLPFLGLYAVGHAWQLWREGERPFWRPFLTLLIAFPMAGLASAIFWLPTNEFIGLSRRVVTTGLTDALPAQQLITLLIPNFFGNPTIGPYWGSGNFSESTIYAGIVSLFLACLAPLIDRRFFPRYIAALTIVIIYFIVGGPGVSWLASVPGLKYASLHRSAFILPLLTAFLAAHTLNVTAISRRAALSVGAGLGGLIGLAFWANWEVAHNYWAILQGELLRAAVFIILTLGLIGLQRTKTELPVKQVSIWLLIALLYTDLFLFGHQFNPAGPIEQLMPPTPAVAFLQTDIGHGRMIAYQREDQVLFGPNTPSIFGLSEAGGYSSLIIARYHDLVTAGDPEIDVGWMERSGNMVTFSYPTRALLDLLQVSHVVSAFPLPDPGLRTEFVIESCERTSNPISQNAPQMGQFVVKDTAINRLDVRFAVINAGEMQGELTIRLWPTANPERLVLLEQIPVSALREQATRTFFFAPQTDAPGQLYEWEISADADNTMAALCLDGEGRPAFGVYGREWEEAFTGEVFIYRRLAPMPRANIVYAAQTITDDLTATQLLLQEQFERRHIAVTAVETGLPSQPTALATAATIIEYAPRRVVINAVLEQPGLLVFGDQYYPGWQATVNGQAQPILRTNQIMRGVLLPPGEHEVLFSFEPFTWRLGQLLTGLGFILLLGMIIDKRNRNNDPK